MGNVLDAVRQDTRGENVLALVEPIVHLDHLW
ncbi:hypothetical protein GcM3_215035 [Golovinomyces cichoracearum]|uniref:Uncharacterized protein n=1 Tax=Golovinomyces cichoracearum TaxID=62708 RepID=A0A420H8U0_9PEZI|nr:hypothetical protein GcM3_215035 [Golovinomyces cichoracearum]